MTDLEWQSNCGFNCDLFKLSVSPFVRFNDLCPNQNYISPFLFLLLLPALSRNRDNNAVATFVTAFATRIFPRFYRELQKQIRREKASSLARLF